jgi:anti-sigma B factor antagonist
MSSSANWAILKVGGEIDLARIDELERLVAANCNGDSRDIAIDLTEVSFMDSTGIGWLLRSRDLFLELGGRFKVIAPPTLDRLFELTGLTEAFEFEDRVPSH